MDKNTKNNMYLKVLKMNNESIFGHYYYELYLLNNGDLNGCKNHLYLTIRLIERLSCKCNNGEMNNAWQRKYSHFLNEYHNICLMCNDFRQSIIHLQRCTYDYTSIINIMKANNNNNSKKNSKKNSNKREKHAIVKVK